MIVAHLRREVEVGGQEIRAKLGDELNNLEGMAIALLRLVLAMPHSDSARARADIAAAIEARIRDKINEDKAKKKPQWPIVRLTPLRALAFSYGALVGDETRLSRYRDGIDKILEMRNRSGVHYDSNEFKEFVGLRSEDWADKLTKINKLVIEFCAATQDVNREIRLYPAVGSAPAANGSGASETSR